MPRKKKSKRGFKLIAFKAYHDTDTDILDWWEGIEEGERSEMIRDLIRGFLGVQSKRRKSFSRSSKLCVKWARLLKRQRICTISPLSTSAWDALVRPSNPLKQDGGYLSVIICHKMQATEQSWSTINF
jgi:hypothetical protein